MASQAQLEELIAEEKAKLAILLVEYERLTQDDNANAFNTEQAKLLRQTQILPTQGKLATLEIQLADLLQIPEQNVPIVEGLGDRPKTKPIVSSIDGIVPTTSIVVTAPLSPIDLGVDPNEPFGNSNIENYVPTQVITDTTGIDEGPQIPNPIGPQIPGLQGPTNVTRAQETIQDTTNANTQGDWRVRLSLAPKSKYLYNATPAGILEYLKNTKGVVFPYLPQIQVTYAANYESSDIVHSNYKMIQYKNSAVDQVTITGDFTAQDTYEANYLLAVIHFFRAVTKMFYGKDQEPKPGTPPPLCYLSGLGDFQFDRHPLVISSFNYSLPNDVDYIRTGSPTLLPGVNSSAYNAKGGGQSPGDVRRQILNPGATESPAQFKNQATNTQSTYVPTKMSISITAYPIVTRNDISNNFSFKEYATGALLQGNKNKSGGGIW